MDRQSKGLLLSVAVSFVLRCAWASKGQVCPFGWTERPKSDRCYLISADDVRYKYKSAATKCQAYGGQTLIVRDATEMNWLLQELSNVQAAFPALRAWWLGMTYEGGHYHWENGATADSVTSGLVWRQGYSWNSSGPCVSLSADGAAPSHCDVWTQILCTRPKGLPLLCDVDRQWKHINDSCYKTFTDQRTWEDARELCQMEGGQLATVITFAEQSELWDVARSQSPRVSFWTGLHVQEANGSMGLAWLNDSVPSPDYGTTATYWVKEDSASNLRVGLSMAIDGDVPTRLYSWVLDNDTALHGYACQKPEGVCEGGWLTHQSRCFKTFYLDVTWLRASEICTVIGARLITLASPSDQAFFTPYISEIGMNHRDSFWIGISDGGSDDTPIQWTDGTPVNVNSSFWASLPAPSNTPGGPDCGYISTSDPNGHWQMTSDCTQLKPFVCVIPANMQVLPLPDDADIDAAPEPDAATVYSAKCGPNWVERPNSDFCYQFHPEAKILAEASVLCGDENGTLVSITSPEELSFLVGRAASTSTSMMWIGAADDLVEGGWFWVDQAPFSFINWNPGEPNNVQTNQTDEDCAVMVLPGGTWYDVSCDRSHAFICKKTANTFTTPAPTTRPTPPAGMLWTCPPGYTFHIQRCYKVTSIPVTFDTAQRACRMDGGELSSVVDQQENAVVFNMMPNVSCDNRHEEDEECVTWAAQGECEKNPSWMEHHCRSACQLCHQPCLDRYNPQQCQDWAGAGECRSNPAWMSVYCARTCNACDGGMTAGGVWLGLSEARGRGSYVWSDLSPVTFTHWRAHSPHVYEQPSCVFMTKDKGDWVNMPCSGNAGYVCKAPLVASMTTTAPPHAIGCPMHAVGYGPFCYQVISSAASTWADAKRKCSDGNSLHGQLAVINSLEVQSLVLAELNVNAGAYYWIGLTDSANPGTFLWSSGDPVLFTAWSPDHTGNEAGRCVGMQVQRPVGLWHALDCNRTLPYVCRYQRVGYTTPAVTTTTATTTPTPCPGGWGGFDHTCYKAVPNPRLSWTDSRDFCRALGGDLASIHNEATHNFIKNSVLTGGAFSYNTFFWIGLTDAVVEATFVWSDGTPTDYTKWRPPEPNNMNGNEDCVEFNSPLNSWNDNTCTNLNPFICALPRGKPLLTTHAPPTTTPLTSCAGDAQWLSHNGSCFYFSPQFGVDAAKSWFAARRFCQSKGGDLASILSQDENGFLTAYMLQRLRGAFVQYWIGFNQLGSENYQWTDGSPVTYQNWNDNEPNDAFGGQDCVNFYSNNGKWNDDNCMDPLHYICKRGTSSTTPISPVPTPLIDGGCPSDFYGIGNVCYKAVFPNVGLNYTGAMGACRAISARHRVDIASITSPVQQAFLLTLLEGQNRSVYIGLNDQHTENAFVWQDNREVTVTYWAPGSPTPSWSFVQEDCVVIKLDTQGNSWGRWDDVTCNGQFGYVCMTLKDPSYAKVSPSGNGCGRSGYVSSGDSCYAAYATPQSWSSAEDTCRRDGGHLVSIRDVHESARVDVLTFNAAASGPFWIGLSFQQTINKYGWVDGWPVSLTQWADREPNAMGPDSCVTTNDGKWNDTHCSQSHQFVCKISTVAPPSTTAPPPGFCQDPSWSPHGAFCYFAAPRDLNSWPEANYLCNKRGMQMMSIHSAEELSFVQDLVTISMTTLTYSPIVEKRVWLGLQRNAAGSFVWSDGSASDYFNWNPGEPNNQNNGEECAELLVDSGKWNDIGCLGASSVQRRGYVCKTPKIIPFTSTMSTLPTTTTSTSFATSLSLYSSFTTVTSAVHTKGPVVPVSVVTPAITVSQATQALATAVFSPIHKKDKSLSGGEVACLVIGLIAAVVVAGLAVFFVRRHRRKMAGESATNFENAFYICDKKELVSVSVSSNGSISNGNVEEFA